MNRQFTGKEIQMTKKHKKMLNFIYNERGSIMSSLSDRYQIGRFLNSCWDRCRAVLPGQAHQHHLGNCQKCKFSIPCQTYSTSDVLNQKPFSLEISTLTIPPGDSDTFTHIEKPRTLKCSWQQYLNVIWHFYQHKCTYPKAIYLKLYSTEQFIHVEIIHTHTHTYFIVVLFVGSQELEKA